MLVSSIYLSVMLVSGIYLSVMLVSGPSGFLQYAPLTGTHQGAAATYVPIIL